MSRTQGRVVGNGKRGSLVSSGGVSPPSIARYCKEGNFVARYKGAMWYKGLTSLQVNDNSRTHVLIGWAISCDSVAVRRRNCPGVRREIVLGSSLWQITNQFLRTKQQDAKVCALSSNLQSFDSTMRYLRTRTCS